MKKICLLFIVMILLRVSVNAQTYDTVGALFKMPSSTSNLKASESTKNYECNLDTLKEDTLKYASHHQYGDAIAVYSACIQKYPDSPYLYNNRANIYKMVKLYKEALMDYDKAIELNPAYLSPYHGKISLSIMQNDLDSAMKSADKVIELSPKCASAYFYKGFIYSYKNNESDALKNYNLAIKYDPAKSASAYFYRGNIFLKQNKPKNAVADYNKSLKLYEGSLKHNIVLLDYMAGEVYYNRGIAYGYLGNLNESLRSFYAAVKYFEAEDDVDNYNNSLDLFKQVYDMIKQKEST